MKKHLIRFMLALALIPGVVGAIEMKAGVAKAVISPPALDGKLVSVNGVPIVGVQHDIFARVLVLNDGNKRLIIVSNDLNCLDVATPILRTRLKSELGIDPASFIPLATHNHYAPIQIVPGNFEYGRWLADRIFSAIQEAIANETGPVQVQFGSSAAYFLKSVGNAPVDFEVQVLRVSREGQPLAVLFNHPTHPLQAKQENDSVNNLLDTGHPGAAVREIEQRIPGAMAIYADGAGGNQFTKYLMEGTQEEVDSLARELADAVTGIAPEAMRDVTGPIASALQIISLPLAAPIPEKEAKRLAEKAAKEAPDVKGCVPYPHPARGDNWIRVLMQYYQKKTPFPRRTTEFECTDDAFLVPSIGDGREFPCKYEENIVATIGPLIFVAMQGEVCAPIGMRIKDTFRHEHPIMVNAYMGEHNLYIPTRELVRLNMYQARVIQTQYASPVGWADTVEDEMVGAVCAMVRDALRRK